ncbi:MAG: class I mannose-6-phosphate isomerase [Defluviitaleaceae bacterium]|nr:class I mannose-6-phosphate isomerase [Defluviitaleaceae bacterium]
MYPLIFKPIIKEMIWGNESWEISCRPSEMSVVENGEFAGRNLSDFSEYPQAPASNSPHFENRHDAAGRFPLLVKIITARDALSVQVHPDDAYARAKGGSDTGKSELWYILEPPTDGYLIIGLKPGVTREILARAYEENTVESCLARMKVSRGDIVNIPAGLIHALTPGTVVAEIQQNSDITYRLYDFGRLGADGKPRELHVQDALNTINYDAKTETKIETKIETEHFSVETLNISGVMQTIAHPGKFSIYTCVAGNITFESFEGATFSVPLPYPRSAFIPAGSGEFKISGDGAIVLKTEPR